MKIVCDSCGAKYSIADEKVAGRMFKIRCKKCGGVIVVRGDEVAAGGSAQASQPPADAVWHIVIDGEQQGPYTREQLDGMRTDGTVNAQTYVWREGFAGWEHLAEVAELQQGEAVSPAGSPRGPMAAQDEMSDEAKTEHSANPQAIFAAAGMTADEVASNRATRNGGADLFAHGDASPFAAAAAGGATADDDVVASAAPSQAPKPAASTAPATTSAAPAGAMTGQRNENSVLFSLSNLQALATAGPSNGSAAPTSNGAAPTAPQPVGEGSGLIDIRALASATGVSGAPQNSSTSDRVDDLLSIGGSSALSSNLVSPVIKSSGDDDSSRKMMLIGLAGVGVGVLSILVVVGMLFFRPAPAPIAAPPEIGQQLKSVADEPSAGEEPPSADVHGTVDNEEDSNREAQAEAVPSREDEGAQAGGERTSDRSRTSARQRDRRSGSSTGSASESAPTETATGSRPSGSSSGGSDIDSLLNRALGDKSSGGTRDRTPTRASNLPETPSKSDVVSALRSVQDAVSRCGQGQHGVARTTVVVRGSTGRVSNARVSGQFQGTPVAACISRAVRGARFPKFQRASFSVEYPFRL